MNQTKGGLAPAKLINLSTNDEVLFMFNPFEYTISKSNTWEKETGKGVNVPRQVFQRGGAQTLQLTLHFDSMKEQEDVRGYTDTLWKMMMIDDQNKDSVTDKGSPPVVAFEWGRLYFKAIITKMDQKFSVFLADGTPVRCTVTVSLDQYVDENEFQPQVSGLPPGQGASQSATVVEGDRLDHVAANNNSDHRTVAEQNNIDDPNNVPPGTSLRV